MQFVKVEFEGPVAKVILNNPSGNRVNFAMRAELLAAFDRVEMSDARVLLVQGDGSDFCLGGDIREWIGVPADILRPKVEVFATALNCLEQISIPTVAVVQGGCMGGGFELALSCDMILASRSARFAFPEARIGIMTLQGGVLQLAERIGRTKAIELVLLSEPVSSEQLATWNIVNRVVDDLDLYVAADALAGKLAVGATKAYASTKELLNIWRIAGLQSAKKVLYDISMPLFDTEDVQSALSNAVASVSLGVAPPAFIFKKR